MQGTHILGLRVSGSVPAPSGFDLRVSAGSGLLCPRLASLVNLGMCTWLDKSCVELKSNPLRRLEKSVPLKTAQNPQKLLFEELTSLGILPLMAVRGIYPPYHTYI